MLLLAASASPPRVLAPRAAAAPPELTVRPARWPDDYDAVCAVRKPTEFVVESGGAGFMGQKVVIDDPEEAQKRQAPTQRIAERFTLVYVPIVIVVCTLLIVLPPLLFDATWPESMERGLTVLVGASPCALAISTPAGVLAGIARTARGGVLVKGGEAIESLAVVKAIAFDKTVMRVHR